MSAPSTLCELMQTVFDIIEKWCIEHEQTVNTDKTKLILFTNKRRIDGFVAPKIFGVRIELSESAKVLGVIFNSKFNWNEHIGNRSCKAIAAFWQCRSAFGKDWGLKPNVLAWVYTAIVRPMLTYAAVIWWPKCQIENT